MSDENIFDDQTTVAKETPAVVIPDEVKDLIGPGKKYASLEAALKSIPHAQSHISTLESEMRELRAKVEQGKPSEDVLAAVQELLAAEREKTPGAAVPDVESLVRDVLGRELTAREQQKIAESNLAKVNAAMKEKYGDKAKEMLAAKAAEIGVGVEFLTSVIAKSADAGLRMLGLDAPKQQTVSSSKGSINTAALNVREAPSAPKKLLTGAATMKDWTEEWRRHDPTKKTTE